MNLWTLISLPSFDNQFQEEEEEVGLLGYVSWRRECCHWNIRGHLLGCYAFPAHCFEELLDIYGRLVLFFCWMYHSSSIYFTIDSCIYIVCFFGTKRSGRKVRTTSSKLTLELIRFSQSNCHWFWSIAASYRTQVSFWIISCGSLPTKDCCKWHVWMRN